MWWGILLRGLLCLGGPALPWQPGAGPPLSPRPQRGWLPVIKAAMRKTRAEGRRPPPHLHSNSAVASSLRPCHLCSSQDRRSRYRTHVLESRGPRESGHQRTGRGLLGHRHCHTCPGHPQALSLLSWPLSCSLSQNSGPAQRPTDPASAWGPGSPLTPVVGRPQQWSRGSGAAGSGVHSHLEQNGTRRRPHGNFWPDSVRPGVFVMLTVLLSQDKGGSAERGPRTSTGSAQAASRSGQEASLLGVVTWTCSFLSQTFVFPWVTGAHAPSGWFPEPNVWAGLTGRPSRGLISLFTFPPTVGVWVHPSQSLR